MLPNYAPMQAALVRMAMAGQLPNPAPQPGNPGGGAIDGGYNWRTRSFQNQSQLPFNGIDPAIALRMQGYQNPVNPAYPQLNAGPRPHPMGPQAGLSHGPMPLSGNTQAHDRIAHMGTVHGAIQQMAQRMSQQIKRPMGARLPR